ncbi:uncharacterized protein LOC135050373 [Pseudophryne corroboree]|uniref:uncharacterized protein LOC135050373 n=1 Tax=Pseudophryne corroboree TaxID=495146 RepID=UPI00308205B1
MEQKFHRKLSWPPASAKAKNVHRHHISDLMKLWRKKTQTPVHSSYRASLRECVSLLHEFLGCSQNIPRTCGCRESSMQHSYSSDAFLHPVFQFLGQREELSGLYGGSGSPGDLLSELFFQLESTCCWRRLFAEAPRLQELLPVYSTTWMPGPRQMQYSCGKRWAAEPEHRVSCQSPVGKSQTCHNHCTPGRRPQEHGTDFPAECLYNLSQARCKDLTEKDVRSDQRPRRGYLVSIRELKNSLKTDLEDHQLYLMDIESRLCGLERRAQDVTRHLERANLELKAIKQGSVSSRTLVGQRRSSLVSSDLEKMEEWDLHVLDSPWEQWAWNVDVLWSDRLRCDETPPSQNKRRRAEDPAHRPDRGRPADGARSCWSHIQTGISLCQDKVNVLIQQVTRQINRTETDLNATRT